MRRQHRELQATARSSSPARTTRVDHREEPDDRADLRRDDDRTVLVLAHGARDIGDRGIRVHAEHRLAHRFVHPIVTAADGFEQPQIASTHETDEHPVVEHG